MIFKNKRAMSLSIILIAVLTFVLVGLSLFVFTLKRYT